MNPTEFKHIKIFEGPGAAKTQTWHVVSKAGDEPLGNIRWFGRWRCYAFYPIGNCVFEQTCLRDIANFCEEKTKALRATWTARKKKNSSHTGYNLPPGTSLAQAFGISMWGNPT